ncbi:unnamed protein product [Bursaphelenchus xylophilus]|uniref:(pine wood nematode) hypothetical protein n=1 Tax=Bursaphelenchus xylophilus TaxID=6326 RepID=A0A1I7S6F6_BURXY|nr:unnamed protein product [Bursaphelenchus xylophilus]CAG9128045.1 unnamed protein product [Bursaphelenchus xylophilus]
MELFLLNPVEYDRLYNCSLYQQGYFENVKVPSKLIGSLYIGCGIVYESLYLPILYVMAQRKFRRFSCYKIMLFLGIIDVICLAFLTILYGIFAFRGMVFCDSPRLFYISGCIATSLWTSTCLTVIILAFNRLCDLISNNLSNTLFSGARVYIWIAIPICYFLWFVWYAPVLLFTSTYYSEFSNPYVGTIFEEQAEEQYISWPMIANDTATPLIMVFLYTIICIVIVVRSYRLKRAARASSALTDFQKTTVIQSCLICCLFVLCGAIYNYMDYCGAPLALVTLSTIIWQACHGGTVIIYLIFNKTLRREILRLFGKRHVIFSTVSLYTNDGKTLGKNSIIQ